nr:CapA family protein [Clostridium sp. AM58-1XD]
MRKMIFRCVLALAAVGFLAGCHKGEERVAETVIQTNAVIEVTRRPEEETAPHSVEPDSNPLAGLPSGTDEGGDPAGEQESSQHVTLLFGGDVLLSDHVLNAYEKAGGIHGVLDEGYRQAIQEADFFMVNQEFPFSDRGTQAEDKQFTFRLPPERVSIFQKMGIDGVTLANNHALDFGQDALMDSAAVLDAAGILHTGAGENLDQAKEAVTVNIRGMNIAVIGATRVIPESSWAAGKNHTGMLATYDPAVLLEEIKELKEKNDYVIVFVHWGVERDEIPQDYQRILGQQYIDAGADLVIGSHPHVLQGIEYYKGKPIVYSLGNFVFGSSIPRTALLRVTLPESEEKTAGGDIAEPAETKGIVMQLIPGTSGAGFTRRLTDEEKLQEFYNYMEGISFGVTYDRYSGEVVTE